MNTSHWGTSVYLCESMWKRGWGKSSETRTHCHGILATVSVSQVTGTDIISCWLVCTHSVHVLWGGGDCINWHVIKHMWETEKFRCVILPFLSAPVPPRGAQQARVCQCTGLNSYAIELMRKQTVGIYVESVPCAHAASLFVRYAKGNMANWCHLVGLLGTRRLSMVPQHIGVVKINTVTLFGRKRHRTIYYCVYFSLTLSHLRSPSGVHTGVAVGVRTHQQQNLFVITNNLVLHDVYLYFISIKQHDQ